MSVIKLKCIGQTLTIVNSPDISSGNVNFDHVNFEFCDTWSGFGKTAIFYRTKDEVYYKVLDENNTCTIPKEVMTSKGIFYIGVFGSKDDITITSQVVSYRVNEGAITENLMPPDPTPDIYAQILADYGAIKSLISEQGITAQGIIDCLGYVPAELDENGIILSSQLPSYVDDVLEFNGLSEFPAVGESGKIYIDVEKNLSYRWGGSVYVPISSSIALGETSSTAYRGDRGKIAYDHSLTNHARADATNVKGSTTNGNIVIDGVETEVYKHPDGTNPHGTTKEDIGLGNVPNVKTNDQTLTFTETSDLEKLTSGEKLSISLGKIGKAISSLIDHIANKSNPHSVTKSQIGLSNVPNVSTNNQTPTFTVATNLTSLSSGDTLSELFGKVAKGVTTLISHLSDTTSHITSTERTKWNGYETTIDNKANKTVATTTANGLMSASDKTKMNNFQLINITTGTVNGVAYNISKYGMFVVIQLNGNPSSAGEFNVKNISNLPRAWGGETVWMNHIFAQDKLEAVGSVYVISNSLYFRYFSSGNYVCTQLYYLSTELG